MFGRIANLFKGFLSLFVSGSERRNPEALLELEQENLRKQIGNFNQGLASHAGLAERLMSQVRKLEAEQRDLRMDRQPVHVVHCVASVRSDRQFSLDTATCRSSSVTDVCMVSVKGLG